ncbi:MAG: hypothetical protein AAGJ82_05725, partial [Bacteroidota bacterium]
MTRLLFCILLLSGLWLGCNPTNSSTLAQLRPDDCIIRLVTPAVFDTITQTFNTYSEQEAQHYPHKRQEIQIRPAR